MTDHDENEDLNPDVPTELLEIHVALEESNMTPEKFKEIYGDQTSNES